MEKRYVVVEWPYSQAYFELKGFDENSELINSEKGLEDFGSSAYFVNKDFPVPDPEIKDKDTYTHISWPESQKYENIKGFEEIAYSAEDGGYFVPTEWYEKTKAKDAGNEEL